MAREISQTDIVKICPSDSYSVLTRRAVYSARDQGTHPFSIGNRGFNNRESLPSEVAVKPPAVLVQGLGPSRYPESLPCPNDPISMSTFEP